MIIFDIINSMFKYYGEYLLSKYNYDKLLIDYANNNSDFFNNRNEGIHKYN